MEIRDFLNLVQYRGISTDTYLWKSFGDNVLIMDAISHDGESSVCVKFNTETGQVFEFEAYDAVNDREYRWIDPDYVDGLKKEYQQRGIDFHESIDHRKFIDIDELGDITEKARAIFFGEPYDTRVVVSLNLTNEEELSLMRLAHENDMTVNSYVAHLLQQMIDQYQQVQTNGTSQP